MKKSFITLFLRCANVKCVNQLCYHQYRLLSIHNQIRFASRFYETGVSSSPAKFVCWSCRTEFQSFFYFCPKCSKLQKPAYSLSFFDLFNLKCDYKINLEYLTKQFRSIQSQLHPDKFSQKDEDEQNLSAEYSSLVNKAYSCLNNPLSRALYMLELKGVTIEEEKTQMDSKFLMDIMELNEEIDAADPNKLINIEEDNLARLSKLYSEFSKAFENDDLEKAKEFVLKIKYFVSIENRIKEIKLKMLG